jgi:hypothetical protein
MKNLIFSAGFCLLSTVIFSQELDLNQLKNKELKLLEKQKSGSVFKKNSLVLDGFTFSNFERFIQLSQFSQEEYQNAKFDFNLPFGGQLEFFVLNKIGIGLFTRHKILSFNEGSTNNNTNTVEKWFTNQLMVYHHVPINSQKSDLSFGLGAGLSIIRQQHSYYGNNEMSTNIFAGSFIINYRLPVTSKVGTLAAIGWDFEYINSNSLHYLPFASIGLFYKIR